VDRGELLNEYVPVAGRDVSTEETNRGGRVNLPAGSEAPGARAAILIHAGDSAYPDRCAAPGRGLVYRAVPGGRRGQPGAHTLDEALANLAEAVELYLDEVDDPAGHITATPLVTSFRLPAA